MHHSDASSKDNSFWKLSGSSAVSRSKSSTNFQAVPVKLPKRLRTASPWRHFAEVGGHSFPPFFVPGGRAVKERDVVSPVSFSFFSEGCAMTNRSRMHQKDHFVICNQVQIEENVVPLVPPVKASKLDGRRPEEREDLVKVVPYVVVKVKMK